MLISKKYYNLQMFLETVLLWNAHFEQQPIMNKCMTAIEAKSLTVHILQIFLLALFF